MQCYRLSTMNYAKNTALLPYFASLASSSPFRILYLNTPVWESYSPTFALMASCRRSCSVIDPPKSTQGTALNTTPKTIPNPKELPMSSLMLKTPMFFDVLACPVRPKIATEKFMYTPVLKVIHRHVKSKTPMFLRFSEMPKDRRLRGTLSGDLNE